MMRTKKPPGFGPALFLVLSMTACAAGTMRLPDGRGAVSFTAPPGGASLLMRSGDHAAAIKVCDRALDKGVPCWTTDLSVGGLGVSVYGYPGYTDTQRAAIIAAQRAQQREWLQQQQAPAGQPATQAAVQNGNLEKRVGRIEDDVNDVLHELARRRKRGE